MTGWLRHHSRTIMWFVVIFIGLPMILAFGFTPNLGSSEDQLDPPVANVGDVPVRESAYRRSLDFAARSAARGGERPTYRELYEDGTAQRVLNDLVDASLITLQQQERDFLIDQESIEALLRNDPTFQDDEGNFSATAWNRWVERGGQDWNAIYDSIREQASRRALIALMTEPGARYSVEAIEEEVALNFVKMAIRYAKIAPPIEITDADLRETYDENQESYRKPGERIAEVIRVPFDPPVPPIALDIVRQAREGADFVALAEEHSTLPTAEASDMGWLREGSNQVATREPLFDLPVGGVSEPISAGQSYFIFKVEDERTDPESGDREVRARQILLSAALTPEEQTAREERTSAIETALEEDSGADLEALASEHDALYFRTSPFSAESTAIDGVPDVDVFPFRAAGGREEVGEVFMATTSRSRYVARVSEILEGVLPPLEDVREQVEQATEDRLKRTDAYKARVQAYTDRIVAEEMDLDSLAAAFPELAIEVKETRAFDRREFLFREPEPVYLQPSQIHGALGEAEPGEVAGPLVDFRGDTHMIALLSREDPTDADRSSEDWATQVEDAIDRAQQRGRTELALDYQAYLGVRYLTSGQVNLRVNQERLERIWGVGDLSATSPAPAPTGTMSE